MQTEVKKNKYSEITNWHFLKKNKRKGVGTIKFNSYPFQVFLVFFSIYLTNPSRKQLTKL